MFGPNDDSPRFCFIHLILFHSLGFLALSPCSNKIFLKNPLAVPSWFGATVKDENSQTLYSAL